MTEIQLLPEYALLIDKRILVISDIHIGFEQALNRGGIYLPPQQMVDILKRIDSILNRYKPTECIINGDIRHDFAFTQKSTQERIGRFINHLKRHIPKISCIEGNHDKGIGQLLSAYGSPVQKHIQLKDALICHGNIIPEAVHDNTVRTIIIGHEHPAVGLRQGGRIELFKCFLKGTYQKKHLIVMPSFHDVTIGLDILREKLQSPFLQGSINRFDVIVPEGDTLYSFGTVAQINRLL